MSQVSPEHHGSVARPFHGGACVVSKSTCVFLLCFMWILVFMLLFPLFLFSDIGWIQSLSTLFLTCSAKECYCIFLFKKRN